MDDDIQEVRDHFFIGSFARAMELILSSENEMIIDLDVAELASLKARTYLGLRKVLELKALKDSKNPGEQAASQMTIFLMSNQERQKEEAGKKILELATATKDLNATTLAAAYLAFQGQYAEALTLIASHDTVELKAVRAHIYLLMNRPDMATSEVSDMNRMSESASITKVCSALLNIANGKHQEAFTTYCDIQALYGEDAMDVPSSMLLNAKAACNLHRGQYQEALEDTQRALALNPKDPDALINMVAISVHMKHDYTPHMQSLKEKLPLHPYVQKSQAIDAAFAAFK